MLKVPSPEVAAALARERPGPMSLPEYARALRAVVVTEERLRAIPLARGERFRLD